MFLSLPSSWIDCGCVNVRHEAIGVYTYFSKPASIVGWLWASMSDQQLRKGPPSTLRSALYVVLSVMAPTCAYDPFCKTHSIC